MRESVDLLRYGPEHPFDFSTGLEIEHSMGEEFERLLTYLLCVVPVLEHGLGGEVVPNLIKFLSESVVRLLNLKLLWHDRQLSSSEYFENEHGMMCRNGASSLGDEVRMRYSVCVSRLHEGIYTVVDILLYAIVDRAFAIGRA